MSAVCKEFAHQAVSCICLVSLFRDVESLGPRSVGDGAEAVAVVGGGTWTPDPAWRSDPTLTDFNVRVFYDKLEDQNLHLASQLSRHAEDLEKFYKKIAQQNEDLKVSETPPPLVFWSRVFHSFLVDPVEQGMRLGYIVN